MMTNATRRGFLGLASAGSALLLPRQHALAATNSNPVALVDDACVLTPQAEEGPFYVDPKLVRSDIGEGKPGVPVSLKFRVIEAGACTPVSGARVDIWHCDARGLYSAFAGQGDGHNIDQSSATFLRGTQMADAAGHTTFNTIYPGWYDGRATHIHFKVFLDDSTVLTGQTFFPEAINEFIYTNVPDYTGRPGQRMVINANDGIAQQSDPEHRAYCAVKEERDRYVAMLTLAVDRNAKVNESRPHGPPPGPPPSGLFGFLHGGPPQAPVIKDRLAALVPGIKRTPF